jgi:hypothetical protein
MAPQSSGRLSDLQVCVFLSIRHTALTQRSFSQFGVLKSRSLRRCVQQCFLFICASMTARKRPFSQDRYPYQDRYSVSLAGRPPRRRQMAERYRQRLLAIDLRTVKAMTRERVLDGGSPCPEIRSEHATLPLNAAKTPNFNDGCPRWPCLNQKPTKPWET